MKTQEQQKAELLDDLIFYIKNGNTDFKDQMGGKLLISKYDQITQQKPLSQDPYCDEVFSGRLLNIISDYWGLENNERLSDLPNIIVFSDKHGFGKKMREEYIDVMTTYEMFDKI